MNIVSVKQFFEHFKKGLMGSKATKVHKTFYNTGITKIVSTRPFSSAFLTLIAYLYFLGTYF